MTPAQQKFVDEMWPHAVAAAEKLGVDPRAIVAQAALETGWGSSQPGGDSNNMFGVKAGQGWRGDRVSSPTREYVGGVSRGQQAPFRSYASPAESVADYARVLSDPRYAAARGTAGDIPGFASALQEGGYATDPNYADKLVGIASQIGDQPAANDPWAAFQMDDAPTSAAPAGADPWAGFKMDDAGAPPARVSAASPNTVPWSPATSLADAITPPPPALPNVEPGQSLTGPYKEGYSLPSPQTTFQASPDDNMMEITVTGDRNTQPRSLDAPDTRVAGWGDVLSHDLLSTIGAQGALRVAGAKEIVQAPLQQAEKRYWQAKVLPDAYQRWKAATAKAKAAGDPLPDLADDPAVREAATRVGLGQRLDIFVGGGLTDLSGMTPAEIEKYKAENQALIEPQRLRREELAKDRLVAAQVSEAAQPNFKSRWSPESIAFKGLASTPDLLAAALTARVAGPGAALAEMGGSVAPGFYAEAHNLGLNDAQAVAYMSIMTGAEVIPEAPVLEALSKTPAGREMTRRLFGKFGKTFVGKAAGTAAMEGSSEVATGLIEDPTQAAFTGKKISAQDMAANALENFLVGSIPGGITGAVHALHGGEAKAEKARDLYDALRSKHAGELADLLSQRLGPDSPESVPARPAPYHVPQNPSDSPNWSARPAPFDLSPPTEADLARTETPPTEAPTEPVAPDPNLQPGLPFGTMAPPMTVGSPAPGAASVEASAPRPSPPQGTATEPPPAATPAPPVGPLTTPPPRPAATESAAPPAPPAPTVSTSAPAPHAEPVSTTAQEPLAGGAVVTPEVKAPLPPLPKIGKGQKAKPLAVEHQERVAQNVDRLRGMAESAGWAERGGLLIRKKEYDQSGLKPEVTGRTKWVSRSDWWPSVQAAYPLRDNEGGQATRAAVEKAITGQPMSPTEQAHVSSMIDRMDEYDAEAKAQNIPEFDPFNASQAVAETKKDDYNDAGKPNVIDSALVKHAADIDEGAVEQAAKIHESDDAGFMEAIRGIIAAHGQSPTSDASGEAVQGAATAVPGAQAAGAAEGFQLTGQAAPGVKAEVKGPAPQADLFGKDETAQGIADRQREKDQKRSPGTDVPADTGGGLFSNQQKQTDITDVQAGTPADEQSLADAGDGNLEGRTGVTPKGPPLPGEDTPTDPLRRTGMERAAALARGNEGGRTPEVAPKRDSTLRRSPYDAIWRDLHSARHPGETDEQYQKRQDDFVLRMSNAPVKGQLRFVTERLKVHFDFKAIDIGAGLQPREALDAMLDAYNNLHNQANVMGQPKEAMGFNGQLSMEINKSLGNKGTRGRFKWDFKQGFGASVLQLARRADSFTHEWLHALDLNLLMRFTNRKALGVSGASNLTLTRIKELPPRIHDAFANVMRAILLTDEASMAKLAGLTIDAENTQAALAKARETLRKVKGIADNAAAREEKAKQYEADANNPKTDPFLAAGRRRHAEQLRAGNAKAATQLPVAQAEVEKLQKQLDQHEADMADTLNSKASQLHQGSTFVDFMQGRKYFSLPAELFARAGESWMGNRIGQQAGVEFLAGSPEYYNQGNSDIMRLVYPNEADRTRIFSAFDELFSALAQEQYFAGETVAARIPQDTRLDKELWLDAQKNAPVSAIRTAINATTEDLHALNKIFKAMRTPISSAVRAAMGVKDSAMAGAEAFKHFIYMFYTARGRMAGLVAKAKALGNHDLAKELRKLMLKITDDPGSGDVQGETLEQEYARQATTDLNELGQIAHVYDLDPDDDAQMAQLYEELAKPTEQVRTELQEYADFLKEKLAETEGDRNKMRAAENFKFHLEATRAKIAEFEKKPPAAENIRKAADKMRELMDKVYYRQQKAGIDVGYVSNYMGRTLDDTAIAENGTRFVEKATMLYQFEQQRQARTLNKQLGGLEDELRVAKSVARNLDREGPQIDAIRNKMAAVRGQIAELGALDPEKAARDWQYSTQVGDMFQFDRATPPSNYTKARKFGPYADIVMAEFYDQHPLSNLQKYLPMAAKRAAYASRFGSDHGKYEETRHKLIGLGLSPADLQVVDEQLKICAGTFSPGLSKGQRSMMNGLYNTAVMALLPFSLFAQLAEPLTGGIRTGRLRDGLRNLAETMQQIINTGDASQMRQIAEMIGIVSSAGNDTIVQNRMFNDVNEKNAKIINNFYKVTGVHGYTRASRVASMKLAGRYVRAWSDTYLNSKVGSKERAAAAEEFGELGVSPDMHEKFARFVQSQENMVSINELLDPANAAVKQAYIVSMHKFVDSVIGNPKASDRARMAFSPVGRFVMSLSSFNYYFQRHVLARFGKRLQRSDNKIRTMIQFAVPFMSLMVGTMAARLLREWLQDRDKFKQRVEDLDTWKTLFNAFDAAGGTGGFAPLYNWVFKSRYQKDMGTIAMGAAAGFYVDAINDIMAGVIDEKDPQDHSGAAERKLARSSYRLIVNSIAPRVLDALGLHGPLGYLALSAATSYNTAEGFGNLTVPKTANERAAEASKEKREHRSPAQLKRAEREAKRRQDQIERRYGK